MSENPPKWRISRNTQSGSRPGVRRALISENPRKLRIAPHGAEFAIWLDDELKGVGDRVEVEEAIGRWQADLDAGQEPDWYIGGLMYDEEARAEIAKLREQLAKRDHAAVSHQGGVNSQEARREEIEQYYSVVERIGRKARGDDPEVFGKVIVRLTIDYCNRNGIYCPKPRQVGQALSNLITVGKVPARKK